MRTSQKDAGSPAGSLVIRLVGLAKTRAMFTTTGVVPTESGAAPYTYRDTLSEDVEFLGHDVQLADFGGRAASGEHTYDFSVTLPPSLPASMKVSRRSSSKTSTTPPSVLCGLCSDGSI